MSFHAALVRSFCLLILLQCTLCESHGTEHVKNRQMDRSPVDLALSSDGRWLVTANETSHTVSLIDTVTRECLDELSIGEHPAAIEFCGNNSTFLISCQHQGIIHHISIVQGKLVPQNTMETGFHPIGIAVNKQTQVAYVGLEASGEIAVLDLSKGEVVRKINVGNWPRSLALTPDGSRLAVACSGDSKIVVVDTVQSEVLYEEGLIGGINLGHLQCSQDGKQVYFPWMVYRSNPITMDNIRRGWVLASRIGRVRMDGPEYREAISLDVPRKAVADPHGLAISSDEQRLVVSASGTHELLVYRLPDLPFIGAGGPGDLIDTRLVNNKDLFDRIPLEGRPMGIVMANDRKTVYVANYLRNSVQVVDIDQKLVTDEISLGSSPPRTLERQGMAIFYDGRRSLDQWYSCHTCHYNGGINSKAMDTWNDGSSLTMKTVLPLHEVTRSAPWTWHGWQTDLQNAMQKSFTVTMQGDEASEQDVKAILAYLKNLKAPPNPFHNSNGTMTESAMRGKAIFESESAGCANCHQGKLGTDGSIHDVGLGSVDDRYDGYNTPVLQGLYRKVLFLHDGRTDSLKVLLTEDHSPEKVSGGKNLSDQEVQDLIAYLKSL